MPTAPTLISYTEVAWNTTTTPKSTTSVSWLAGDIIVFIGGCDEGSVTVPTATGLTFTSQRSFAGGSSACGSQCATAVAAADGSSAITSTHTVVTTFNWGFGVWVFRNSAGVGNSAEQHTTTKTVSLTPTGPDGAIVWGTFDFSAGALGTIVPTPTNTRERAVEGVDYTAYVSDLTDQTSGGAVSYGISGGGTGPFSIVVLEIKGAASTPTVVPSVPDAEYLIVEGAE